MRRALALRMGMPLRVLSRLMTYAELLDWCRVFAEEPFDDRRCFDLPAAAIQSTLIGVHFPKAKVLPSDLMPFPIRKSADDEVDLDRAVLEKL